MHVLDRGFDEIRLPEQHLIGPHPVWQGSGDFGQCRLDIAGQLHGIDIGLLFDRNDNSGLPHIPGLAAFQPRAKTHVGHLMQQDRPAAIALHHHLAQILKAEGAADVADQKLTRVLVGETASGVGPKGGNGGLHLGQRYPKGAQGGGVWCHAELAHLAADGDHLCHARDGQKARAYDEISGFAQFHG